MDRRKAFQRISILLGGIALAPELMAKALADSSVSVSAAPPDRLRLLNEMAETIIPETDTPGAKAANVGEFIIHAVETCLPADRRRAFYDGLDRAEAACTSRFGRSFADCNESQRISFFTDLEKQPSTDEGMPPFFTALKMLTLHGYFTSEIGATQALNYDPVPGGWVADMVINDQTKAWTSMF
ncbi:MAG: hypothetical protein RL013_767 [Bacteroidota bacterium]|jgi:hypothetical protein